MTVVLTGIALAFLGWFVTRTNAGLGMRAAAEDLGAAQLVGLDVNRLIVVAFAIASGFAGLAGVLWAAQAGIVEPDMGFTPLLKAFVAAIIGGFGSIAGALLGGYVLGALEVFIVAFLPSVRLALPRRHRLRAADRLPAVQAERHAQPDAGGETVSRAAAAAIALCGLALVALATWALPHLVNDYFVRVVIVMCINAVLVCFARHRERLHRRLLARPRRLRRASAPMPPASCRCRRKRRRPTCRTCRTGSPRSRCRSCRRPSWRGSSASSWPSSSARR